MVPGSNKENHMDEQKPKEKEEYQDPSLLDIEDLEGVSGGGCATGGTIIVKPADADVSA
jgi:hypothetical protein